MHSPFHEMAEQAAGEPEAAAPAVSVASTDHEDEELLIQYIFVHLKFYTVQFIRLVVFPGCKLFVMSWMCGSTVKMTTENEPCFRRCGGLRTVAWSIESTSACSTYVKNRFINILKTGRIIHA